MPSMSLQSPLLLYAAILVVVLARPCHAFGAGNIASAARIEGSNWRHGDIEDTLLTLIISRAAGGKKFSKMDVKRVYFGNWLRDYSQAVDVGTVKYTTSKIKPALFSRLINSPDTDFNSASRMVSAEAIRILVFRADLRIPGRSERLGCYRPEEHIDNPKDYADNLDARKYDPRLRGPVDERRELSINPQTGLKNYIASEGQNITTSAGNVRDHISRCVEKGRQYARSGNKAELYEALRLLGTANHCLEDFSAHSNYTELALIEMGERQIFPHVGRQTQVRLPGLQYEVYPIVTGTFGGVDFLHSVIGEFSDKAAQSEIQELEGTIESSQGSGQNTSLLHDIFNSLPSGLFGGKDQGGKLNQLQQDAQTAQMQNMNITPKKPEEWTRSLEQIKGQIYPIMEWHDEVLQSIAETIEKIPILPDLIEKFQDQLNIFIFSLMAPLVLPIIRQVKTELTEGSSEIIQSSRAKQHIVFEDDRSSDPTHSMLSKDHFSNILNEPAGKVASQVLKWVVPQIIACWDDERISVDRTINRILNGVFHHPALRNYGDDGAVDGRRLMFGVVEQWWHSKSDRERDDLRSQLSREGVEQGRNHKEGVHDTGHGCGKPLGMSRSLESGGPSILAGAGASSLIGNILSSSSGNLYGGGSGGGSSDLGKMAGAAVGGGALGGLVGIGAGILGEAFTGEGSNKTAYSTQGFGQDGSFTQSYTEAGKQNQGNEARYGQAQFSQTSYPDGRRTEVYKNYEQQGQDGYVAGGSRYEERQETRPKYGGGYQQKTETRYGRPDGGLDTEVRYEGRDSGGDYYSGSRPQDSYDEPKKEKHHKKKHHGNDYDDSDGGRRQEDGRERESENYGGGYGGNSRNNRDEYQQGSGSGYGSGRYERENTNSGGWQEERSGRNEEYGGTDNDYRREEEPSGGLLGFLGGNNERREERSEESGGGLFGFGGGDDDQRDERSDDY
ncbi:MAG: hypothetical protein M1829_001024 [Trizodia sp. TS-e1964]|nr:MAG: hypothetical protein M1829_001024 [Trizodia sp. TS-e1964]